jgi:hypothetical protein
MNSNINSSLGVLSISLGQLLRQASEPLQMSRRHFAGTRWRKPLVGRKLADLGPML